MSDKEQYRAIPLYRGEYRIERLERIRFLWMNFDRWVFDHICYSTESLSSHIENLSRPIQYFNTGNRDQ